MLFSTRVLAWSMAAILGLAVVQAPSAARAHAVIIESMPAVNAAIDGSAVVVALRYNSRIDHERSRLTLVGPDGKPSTLDIVQDGPPDMVSSHATGLTPGAYRLRWQVLSVDGHLTRGDIPFTVKTP